MNYTDTYTRFTDQGLESITLTWVGDDVIVIRYIDAVEVSETRMTHNRAMAETDKFTNAARGASSFTRRIV